MTGLAEYTVKRWNTYGPDQYRIVRESDGRLLTPAEAQAEVLALQAALRSVVQSESDHA